MLHIDSFGWGINIILLICFVITLFTLVKGPKGSKKIDNK